MCAPPRFVVILGGVYILARPLLPAPCQFGTEKKLFFLQKPLTIQKNVVEYSIVKIKTIKLCIN